MTTINTAIFSNNQLQAETAVDVFSGNKENIKIIDYGDRDPLAMLLNWRNSDINSANSSGVNTVKYGERLLQHNNSNVKVHNHYTADELETAQKIRHYYQAKIVMRGLRGEKLTSYQSKLGRVLTDCNKLDEDAVGVLIRLVDFYIEDRAMDELLEHRVSFDCNKGDEYNPNEQWKLVNSSAIESLSRKQHQKRYFLENQKKHLIMLYAHGNKPNGNAAVLDALVENFDCFSVSGPITKYPLPGRYFAVGTVTHRNSLKVCK